MQPHHYTAEQYAILTHFAELATRELERERVSHELLSIHGVSDLLPTSVQQPSWWRDKYWYARY